MLKRIAPLIVIAGLASAAGLVSSASAQSQKALGEFKAWKAYEYKQGAGTRCTMASQPTKDAGDYSKRGEIWGFVMHRPAEGSTGEVGFQMGYPIKDGSQVTVKIGSASFQMYTQGEGAFAYRADEPAMIQAMRKGSTMVVTGISSRGTKTTDTYSLSGFSAAKKAIDGACGVK